VIRIDKTTADLPSHPTMGRTGRVAGTRELIVTGTPCIVAYRVRDDTV
jgi:toxin ParE1/3/4